jgi:membrane-bound lytic murein transglycosylase D
MKRKGWYLIVAVLFCTGLVPVQGAMPPHPETESPYAPEQYDSLFSEWYETTAVEAYDKYLHDFIDIEPDAFPGAASIPDSVYASRLRMIASVIELPYNDVVRRYIEAYTGRLHEKMEQMLGLSQVYFPLIEEELDRQGLPQELKILPMIESALSPKAVSRAGAAGLWQFMLRTGKGMGLEVNSFVDQRLDPVASTRAACRYLKQLYDIYGDWMLVIAAYNCGPGNVNKALRRAQNPLSYWDIYPYLPRETRGYIPSFIAATYAYTFHKAHAMEPSAPPVPLSTDTVMIHKMMHFEQVSSTLGLPVELLRELNPQYKLDIVPATDKPYELVLPFQQLTAFVDRQEAIYASDSLYLKRYLNPANFAGGSSASAPTVALSGTTYKVRSGDVPGSIAQRFGVSTRALLDANNITNPRGLQIGQVLQIPR